VIYLLISRCMVYACDFLVICYHWIGYFPRLIVVLALCFYFLNIHGVVGFYIYYFFYWCSVSLWLLIGTNALEA